MSIRNDSYCIDETLHQQCETAPAINEQNGMQIIRDNQNTEFGREYQFADMKSVSDFRKKVPISDYETFRPYIEKMRQDCSPPLTIYPVVGYCHTSGTTGDQKYIPMTVPELERYSNYFEKYQDQFIRQYGGKRLFLNTFRTIPGKKVETPLLFTEIYYKNMREQGYLDMDSFAGGDTLLFSENPGDIFFAKLWISFLEEHITILESIFLYDHLCFFSYLEENWEDVLRSIRTQTIPDGITLSETVSQYLLSLPFCEKRLQQVETECRKGFDNIAGRLWPKLRLLSGISSKAFFSEDTALKRYAPDISRYYFCYCASECYMGHPLRENDFRYVLMPGHAFFEFLPYKENEGTTITCLPHEVEIGKQYEIIYTTFTGLYRYRMGDIVTIKGFYEKSPIMEFAFRKNQLLNIAGEKMSVVQIEEAIQTLCDYGIKVEQYCFGASLDHVPGRYLAGLVLNDNTDKAVKSQELSLLLDKILQEKNMDYKDLRNLHRLDCLDITIFDKETYILFLQKNGLRNGHNKPKHIASNGFLERNLHTWKEK